MRRGFTDSKGRKVYRRSFCAYFDILGFKQKIIDDDLDFFNKYLNILETELKFIEELKARHSMSLFEIKVFTDNFVIGYPWRDSYGESELGDVFDMLCRIQYKLAVNDIFIRGAISISDLFMDKNIVLGKAIIESYELESQHALYPRIILSEDVKDVVKEHIGYYKDRDLSPQYDKYLIDIDGNCFLNYLFYVKSVLLNNGVDSEKLLLAHKIVIEKNLEMHKNDYRVFQKYEWIGKYHNYFCGTFFSDKPTEVKVDSQLLNSGINRIEIPKDIHIAKINK